jgi:membrane protein involved in colicin uptake
MEVGTALGGTGLFVSIAGIIYSAINHKHIKSTCCGRKFDFSIDIDSTENEAKEREAREKEAKEKEAKEAKEKEAKDAKEKEAKDAKEKEAKVGNSKFDDYSIFKLKPRIVPHFNV